METVVSLAGMRGLPAKASCSHALQAGQSNWTESSLRGLV